jgi:hypothetical protein
MIVVVVVIITEVLNNKVSSVVITDEKDLSMNCFSVYQTSDTVFSVMYLIAVFQYFLAIDADKFTCLLIALKCLDRLTQY